MFALLKRRNGIALTWRGWLCLLVGIALGVWLAGRWVHPFLAVEQPVPSRVLVVEGWLSDLGFQEALRQAQAGHYERVYVTGGPISTGSFLTGYSNYARLGQLTLTHLGLTNPPAVAVPAPLVRQDRTYTSAVALRRWMEREGAVPSQFNVISMGPHARRSRLLFEKAFGPKTTVGVIAVPVEDYDPDRWWATSAGVRTVVDEVVAYFYARCLFRASADRAAGLPPVK